MTLSLRTRARIAIAAKNAALRLFCGKCERGNALSRLYVGVHVSHRICRYCQHIVEVK